MYEFGTVEESFWIFTLRTLAPDRMILDEWLTSIQIFEMRSVMYSVKVSQHYVSSRVPLGQQGYKIVSRWKGVRNIHSCSGIFKLWCYFSAVTAAGYTWRAVYCGQWDMWGSDLCETNWGHYISVEQNSQWQCHHWQNKVSRKYNYTCTVLPQANAHG